MISGLRERCCAIVCDCGHRLVGESRSIWCIRHVESREILPLNARVLRRAAGDVRCDHRPLHALSDGWGKPELDTNEIVSIYTADIKYAVHTGMGKSPSSCLKIISWRLSVEIDSRSRIALALESKCSRKPKVPLSPKRVIFIEKSMNSRTVWNGYE